MTNIIFINKTIMLLFAIILFLLITSLWGFYNSIRPQRIISSITPADLGLKYENVSFMTQDDIALDGWFLPALSYAVSPRKKVIILLHGYPADKGDILPIISFLNKDHALLLFDFRYFGKSGGRISTAGAREVRDLQAAVQFLKSRGIEEIGVWGFSIGGATALMAAPHIPEIKAVVSDSAYARLDLLTPELYRIPGIRHVLGFLTRFWGILFLGIDAKKVAPAWSAQGLNIPILVIHSKGDEVISFRHALLIQDALKGNPRAEFWFWGTGIHGQLEDGYQTRVQEFFAKNL